MRVIRTAFAADSWAAICQRLGRGPQDLTTPQTRALQKVITSAGEACGAIVGRAFLRETGFLRDTDPALGWERGRCSAPRRRIPSWCVQTGQRLPSAAAFGGGFSDSPCAQPHTERPYGGRRPPEGPLNPDLQKLLEPMTAKDGKTD
jgi:hypothetical protein